MCDYIEGRASIKSFSNGDIVFVELSDALVDCTPNQEGMEAWFNKLSSYVPINFMEELAKRLMEVYAVEVTVVDGRKGGFIMRHATRV
jgi:hypothetical protein